jgi:hypothetical protein
MKLFTWKVAIILIVLIAILTILISGYIHSIYGSSAATVVQAFFPFFIIFYFIAWVLMWNNGKAKSPFKIAKLLDNK